MNPRDPAHILDAVASDHVRADVDLLPHIMARFQRKTFLQTLRARPALALLIAVLSLLLLSGVVYAIGRSLGYLPGVGLLEDTQSVRILPGAAEVSRGSITIQVRSLTTDGTQTLLSYRIRGIPLQGGAASPECTETPTLQLPEGIRLQASDQSNSRVGGENGFIVLDARITFPPIPSNVNEVTLMGPCELPPMLLHLVPAPQGLVLTGTEVPVTFESSRPLLPTPTLGPTILPPRELRPELPSTPTPVPNGSGLYLEKVIELDSAYLLLGNFTNAGDLPGDAIRLDEIPFDIRVTDRNGQSVPAWVRQELIPAATSGNVGYWAIEVPRAIDPPLTLSLPAIALSNDRTFAFPLDVGTNPAAGHTWQVDKVVQSGAFRFLVEQIRRDERGYTLSFRSLDSLSRQNFFCIFSIQGNNTPLRASERFHEREGRLVLSESLVFQQAPAGKLTFLLEISTEASAGPWTLTWSPP
ncbi:MAG: hypothetical protein ACM3QS_03740 [Bacteroidota bacterium]